MAGRYGIGRLVENKEFTNLQSKLESLYESYNSNPNCTNVEKTCEIIEKNADVQRQLHGSLHDITAEGGPIYHCPRPLLRPHCDHPYYHYSRCYYPALTASTAAAIAASASLSSDLALCRTLSRKNAEIEDLSNKFKTEVSQLENELNSTKQTNDELKAALNETKEKLESEKAHLDSVEQARQSDIESLKQKLGDAESKLAALEPRAEKATELEKEITNLKDEIRHVRTANYILTDENIFQAEIIRSRAASPCYFRSRTPSPPCVLARSRCVSPVCVRTRVVSPVCISRVSPLSPNHCTQVVRQEALITRYNDLYLRDRLTAMDTLRTYSENYENNQRIIFAAVQDSFSAAKRAFYEWKIRVRSTVSITHIGPETLEEAVQDYINRNVDLYDMPRMVSDVLVALNRNPKISLPCGVTYSVISQFIRETCRMAWEMTALAYPLDTAFALDAEVIDESRYRRSFDSEFSAPLISHHIWPCLMQSGCVISRGEACTRRGASLHCRPVTYCRERSCSPIRRSRSTYHH